MSIEQRKEQIISLCKWYNLSTENTELFTSLCFSSKWKNKSLETVEKTLKKLMKYEDKFVNLLIKRAIINKWQGVVFSDTDAEYIRWVESNKIDKILNAFNKL